MPMTYAYPSGQDARGVAIRSYHQVLGAAGTRYRPTRIPVFAQGNEANTYSTTKRRVFSAEEVGEVEGWGSPAHLMVQSLFPKYGGGVGSIEVTLYPLAQPATGGVQATGSITPVPGTLTKTQEHQVKIGNILSDKFSVVSTDTAGTIATKIVAAINAILGMPVVATDETGVCSLKVKWEGASGNNVYVEVVSPIDTETTFTIVHPENGAGTPDISAALAQIGNTWETHAINSLDYTDSDELDEFALFGEGRRASEVHKPLCVFTGCNASWSDVTTVTDARKTDRTNVILTNSGSHDLPFVIAADQVREIAKMDNQNPPHDYGSLPCTGLTPAADGDQWTSAQRDAAVKMGCSTVHVKDGVVQIGDVVTCYHPIGEDPPGFRYVVDFAKRSTAINELDLEFNSLKWDGKPLIPDNQVSTNPEARKPKHAVAALYRIIDVLALDAIIADPDFAKENSSADIGLTNPKRLDVKLVAKLAGNANVISIDFASGFNYGGQS
jgi:phage tail sheath gpL-like